MVGRFQKDLGEMKVKRRWEERVDREKSASVFDAKAVRTPQVQGVGNVSLSNTNIFRLRQIFDYVHKGKLCLQVEWNMKLRKLHIMLLYLTKCCGRVGEAPSSYLERLVWNLSPIIDYRDWNLIAFLNPPGIFSSYYFQLSQDRFLSHSLQIHNPPINLWLDPLHSVLLAVSVSSTQINKQCLVCSFSVQTNAISFYGCNCIALWSSIYCDHSSGHVQGSENKNTNVIN
jgi:hypothetical protein